MSDPVTFRATIRRWKEDAPGGLAVADVPADLVPQLGGRRQYRVEGTLNAARFRGSTMLVAGGGFCVGVSRAALDAAGVAVGDEVALSIARPAGPSSGVDTPPASTDDGG
jgi:hypothetical protein